MTTFEPTIVRKRLFSYGGQSVRVDVVVPRDERELRSVLVWARDRYSQVTFRAAGRSFDTQSLNDTLVIELNCFDEIAVSAQERTVTVGASARWGEILTETAKHGLVPFVTVTSSKATAGGTLSADCISRFSPTCGKEGDHVTSFDFISMTGQTFHCSRTEHPALFRAAITGMGYLGVITRITYRLMSLPFRSPELAVKTEVQPFVGLAGLVEALVPRVAQSECCSSADVSSDGLRARALSAVVYMNAKRQGFIMSSQYVRMSPSEREGKGAVMHQPYGFAHQLLQFLALFRFTRTVGFFITLNFVFAKPREYIDELVGFTFFQDGNEIVRTWGRRMRLPMGLRQQTYVIPWDARAQEASKDRLRTFLEQTDALLDGLGILPTLIDVLYLPRDEVGFALSSSRETAGFAMTVAVEDVWSSDLRAEEDALRAVAQLCASSGGRVHLVKHVYAAPELLHSMYLGLREFLDCKRATDPAHRLRNEFLRRVFPDASQSVLGRMRVPDLTGSDARRGGGPD